MNIYELSLSSVWVKLFLMAKSSFPLVFSGLQGHRRGIPQDCWRSDFRLFFSPFLSSHRVCMKTHGERLSVSVRQTSISWLSRIFAEKQDPSTSVKEQLSSDRKRGDLICALALSPITCVFASSQWLSSSLSWTNERRFVRSFPHCPPHPFLTSSSPPQPPRGQLERNFTLG